MIFLFKNSGIESLEDFNAPQPRNLSWCPFICLTYGGGGAIANIAFSLVSQKL